MMESTVIFGVGELAQLAGIYFSRDSPYRVAAYTVHERYLKERSFMGLPVVPFEGITSSHPPESFSMFVAVGYTGLNHGRARVYQQCRAWGYRLVSYLNSRTISWGEIELGDNCFIFEANVIQPFVTIGADTIVWSGNFIGHHTRIGEHCFIASNATISGKIQIGPYCFIGANATLRDGIALAPRTVVGAGAIILHDTVEGAVYKGLESRPGPKGWDEVKL